MLVSLQLCNECCAERLGVSIELHRRLVLGRVRGLWAGCLRKVAGLACLGTWCWRGIYHLCSCWLCRRGSAWRSVLLLSGWSGACAASTWRLSAAVPSTIDVPAKSRMSVAAGRRAGCWRRAWPALRHCMRRCGLSTPPLSSGWQVGGERRVHCLQLVRRERRLAMVA